MSDTSFRLAVVKLGCIGAAPLADLILDERADRDDIAVRGFTSGAKLDPESCEGPVADALRWQPQLALVVSPNAALPGPGKARELLAAAGVPFIAIGDSPSKKAFYVKNEAGKQVPDARPGQGFVVLPFDPMIGARRELLDPTEMALFNADVIRLLAATGALRAIQNELDRVIAAIKAGAAPVLPALTLEPEQAVEAGGFANPYAAAKALAALKIAEAVAGVTTRGCFMEKEPARYIPQVAAGHEMMRTAAALADAARELEKSIDTVLRTPHSGAGETRRKTRLLDKPA
ncbi:MAG: F420-dependent methylenetetrahydromethanopterin dehydrogenase [Gammaproteobacteria bacterium]